MALGRRKRESQARLWVATQNLTAPGHPFYKKLNRVLDKHGFDAFLERAFAHLFETGGMRRLFLRGRQNILKRLLIHVCGFNLGLLMRQLVGKGTPRGMKGLLFHLWSFLRRHASRLQAPLGRLRLNA